MLLFMPADWQLQHFVIGLILDLSSQALSDKSKEERLKGERNECKKGQQEDIQDPLLSFINGIIYGYTWI